MALAVFAVASPMAFIYHAKFWADIQDQIITPHTGASKPIFLQQFYDVQPQLYWLTNMFWALGPAMETDPQFPNRTNVQVARRVDDETI